MCSSLAPPGLLVLAHNQFGASFMMLDLLLTQSDPDPGLLQSPVEFVQ